MYRTAEEELINIVTEYFFDLRHALEATEIRQIIFIQINNRHDIGIASTATGIQTKIDHLKHRMAKLNIKLPD